MKRKNMLKLEENVIIKKGKRYILLPEKKYRSIVETLYLLSSPRNRKILKQSISQPVESCRDWEKVLHELEN